MRHAPAAAFLVLLSAATSTGTTYPSSHWPPHHVWWDNVLRAVVRGESVDYALVRRDHLPTINTYLDELAEKQVALFPRDEQLALYLNLYNATMLKAVADRYRPGYSPAEENYKVFKEPLVRVGGKSISLDDLEHKLIRPTFKDPRVHAALNCAARSCPPLLPRAYRADDLDATLDVNMKRFVNDPSRNQADDRKRQLRLSRIFDWFADDFGGKPKVPTYVGKHLGKDVSRYAVTFSEYDWTLNDVPR